MELDKRIIKFIKKHNVLTLATATFRPAETMVADKSNCGSEQQGRDRQIERIERIEPYCSNMFYAYMADENLFVFTSDDQTRHIADVGLNATVGGSIVLESMTVGKLQGLQFQGVMSRPDSGRADAIKRAYLLRFPFAAAMPLNLWIIEPTFMKFTDNKLGFGTKLIWHTYD